MKRKKMLKEAGLDLIYKGKMHSGRVAALAIGSLCLLATRVLNIVVIAFLFMVFSAVIENPMGELIPLENEERVRYEYAKRFLYSSYWSLIYFISRLLRGLFVNYSFHYETFGIIFLTTFLLFQYGMLTRTEYQNVQGNRKFFFPKLMDRMIFLALFYELCIQGREWSSSFFLFEWTKGISPSINLVFLLVVNVISLIANVVQYQNLIAVRDSRVWEG